MRRCSCWTLNSLPSTKAEGIGLISLDSFTAQGDAAEALIQDVRRGRAPHAILLTGMAGVGKRTLARLLACAFLCTGEGDKPCMQCKGCRRALDMSHPDLLTPSCTEKERTVKVDHLREIIHALSLHSSEGGERVVLLENAQRMTVQAQNALLKSLEEPLPGTHFLLTASGDTGLLSTVRSRCRVVRMPPWEQKRIEEELRRRGEDEPRARELAILSGGSLGLALSMQGDADFFKLRTLCEKTFFSLRGAADVPEASALLRDRRDDAQEILSMVGQRVREYLLYAMHAGARPAATEDTRCDAAWAHAAPLALERVSQAVIDAERHRQANVSWQAAAERLLYIIAEEIVPWQQS